MRKKMLVHLAAIAGAGLAVGSPAFADINPSDFGQWLEIAGNSSSFGGDGKPIPPTAAEVAPVSFGGANWDMHGRTIALAEVPDNLIGGAHLTSINSRLWSGNDVDLYKIKITNPTAFSMYNGPAAATTLQQTLTLFSANGTAIAASKGGGTANAITSANSTIPGAGIYYVGIGVTASVGSPPVSTPATPQNNAGQALFDLSTFGVKAPLAVGDLILGTTPLTAWSLPGAGATSLLTNTTFDAGTAQVITFSGADFAVPEPTSLATLGFATAGLLARRRRTA